MERGETVNPSERFNQLIFSCLEAERRVADLVLGNEGNLFDPLSLSQEAIDEMSPTEIFLVDAMNIENDLVYEYRENIITRMSVLKPNGEFVKAIFAETEKIGIQNIFATSEKPITDIIASGYAADFFESIAVTYPITEENKVIKKLRDSIIDIYLFEKGAFTEILTKYDDVVDAELKADIEWSMHDRIDVSLYISWLTSSMAISKMVENGLIPEDHNYEDVTIKQLPDTDRPIVVLTHKLQKSPIEGCKTTINVDESYTDNDGMLLVERHTLTRTTVLEKGVMEEEIDTVDPVKADLLFALLDYKLEAYQELEAMGSERLNQLIRQKLNNSID